MPQNLLAQCKLRTSASCSKRGTASDSKAENNSCATSSTCRSADHDDSFWSDLDVWRRAGTNTVRCLIGCSIGDLSTLWLLGAYYPALGVPITVAASCIAGITTSMCLETAVLRVTEDLAWITAWRTAAGMSLLSMVSMELAENAVELYLTGGDPAVMCGPMFWQAMPAALAAGYLTPLPYNYFMLKKHGRGCH